MIGRISILVKDILERNRYIRNYKNATALQGKIYIQIITAIAFLALSVANYFSKSYLMMVLTLSGCAINLIFALIAKKSKKAIICSITSITTCAILFSFFVIYGGNDGFACQWVILLPLLSMAAMDFIVGLCTSLYFAVFLIIVFWTPVRYMLFYSYGDQFCLRFPLFFLTAFLLSLLLTLSMQKSEYNEYKRRLEVEAMSEKTKIMAQTDPLTKLANRRFAYEEFDAKYISESCPHCIVMGDIDSFKIINDTYGHEFGDDVLVIIADYIINNLPPDYLKARWGGEEFLFAANAPISEVYEKVEELREIIANREFNCNGTIIRVTLTFGIAEYQNKSELINAISVADNRLYLGKQGQKNCTVING